jgi:hypothetical protein
MARMAWEGRGSQAMNAARLVLLLVAVAAGRVGGDDASMLHPLRPHDVMEMNLTKVLLAPQQILTSLHPEIASDPHLAPLQPRVRNLSSASVGLADYA